MRHSRSTAVPLPAHAVDEEIGSGTGSAGDDLAAWGELGDDDVVAAEENDIDDGWGLADEPDDATTPQPDTTSKNKPLPQPTRPPAPRGSSPKPSPSVPFDDGGEPDFAGWLLAQSQARAAKTLSSKKPLKLAKRTTTTATTKTVAKVGGGGGSATVVLSSQKKEVSASATASTGAGTGMGTGTGTGTATAAGQHLKEEEDDWSAWD
ncbi:hypothetical protein KEM52_003439 [Ascosphaera acerosa]|nr:hypothetical protein KEM52_003439 [Ascosphaera acerosa]